MLFSRIYYVYSSRVCVLFTKLSLLLSSSLSLSSQTTTETRKHTTTTNSEEKHLFLKTIAEREKESKKFSPFVQKKTQKSHKVTRKSAEKQSQLLITTFALVFIATPRHSLLHTRDINNNINKNKK